MNAEYEACSRRFRHAKIVAIWNCTGGYKLLKPRAQSGEAALIQTDL